MSIANDCEAFIKEITPFLSPGQIERQEPMERHTTFRVGGVADCVVYPATIEDVRRILSLTVRYGLPLTIMGNGSNLLVRDKGIRGVVLIFGKPAAYIERRGMRLIVGAGTLLGAVAQNALQEGLSGLEFAAGIPGSLGGAVFMNAGAYGGEMKQIVTRITALDGVGKTIEYATEEAQFGYRTSIFQENQHIICEVEVSLTKGDPGEIRAAMEALNERRRQKQPLEYPSAGSTFKRPPGYFAGTLIDETGLKGLSIGGAQVSEKHAGFIINRGGATAEDILALIAEVQRRVFEARGIKLIPEVRIVGEE